MKALLKTLVFVTATLAIAVVIPQAHSQTTNVGNFYVGVNVGVLIPDELSFHVPGTAIGGGETATASGNIDFDTGAAAGAFGGYHLNNWLAVEGDFQYGAIEFNSLKGTGTLSGPVAGSGPFNLGVDGHGSAYTFLGNAIVTPFGRVGWNGFTLYAGGGAGFTTFDDHIHTFSANGATIAVNENHSETDFTMDAIAGFDFAVTPQISLGGRYQFIWVSLGNVVSGASNGDFTGHMLTANMTYHF